MVAITFPKRHAQRTTPAGSTLTSHLVTPEVSTAQKLNGDEKRRFALTQRTKNSSPKQAFSDKFKLELPQVVLYTYHKITDAQ